jgi:hypothetical protein
MKSLLFHLGLHSVEDIHFDQLAFWQRPMATNPSVNRDILEPAQEPGNKDMVTPINVAKEYAPCGRWKLFRLRSSPNFTCSRCCKHTFFCFATNHDFYSFQLPFLICAQWWDLGILEFVQ